MNFQSAWDLLKTTFSEFLEDRAPRLGAALAFYSILSIAPLLLLVIAIAGSVFGREAVRGQLTFQMDSLIGERGAAFIQEMLANSQQPGQGLLASIVGFATLLFGATGVFGELQDSMNMIWGVRPKPGQGFWPMVRQRFVSFAMVLGIAFLLLATLVISTVLAALGKYFATLVPYAVVMDLANIVVSFAVVTLLFAMIFKVLPDVEITWRDVWIGAVLTALLFTVGKHALGVYLGQGSTVSVYGAAGSLVVVLLWVFFSAQILFFGAEFTQVYAQRQGRRLVPSAHAERINGPEPGKSVGERKGAVLQGAAASGGVRPVA
jgi:membrane protein